MTDVLHCATCSQPLQIVCPEHGTNYVPDRRVNMVSDTVVAPKATRTRTTVGDRIMAMLSDPFSLRAIPNTDATDCAYRLNITTAHASVELSNLFKAGRLVLVKRGLYTLPESAT